MTRNVGLLSVCLVLFLVTRIQGLKLKQVVILSRHNIRTPLTENLQYASPNIFPKWESKAGDLTEKGVLLEEYMGDYFQKWLVKHKLLPEGCPQDESVHIYANTRHRTKETAKAFTRGAFKDCNVTVYSIDSEEMDPIFNPIFRNNSEELKAVIVSEMQEKINALQLDDIYAMLNDILNLKQSKICKTNNVCDLRRDKDEIVYEVGTEPNISGPLNLANAVVDSFLMSYYDGKPIENVAWGAIKTPEQWELLTKITKENQNIRFNSTILAKEVTAPLLNYMLEIFERKTPLKFTLLVGHDSNLNPVMASLNFVPKDLPGQFERTPVGGKLVFQKWEDDAGNNFLKVDFVYESFEQLRSGSVINMDNPPQWVSMQIRNCSDKQGFCSWESFLKLMKNILT